MDKTVSTRVADKTYQQIENYTEAHGMTRSEAIRSLIRTGLHQSGKTPGVHITYGGLLAVWGLIFVATQYADATGLIGPIGIGALIIGFAHDLAHRLGLINWLRGENK